MDKQLLDNLMQKVQCGNEDAFLQLYKLTYKGVFSFAYTFVKNYHDCEDIVQETFVKLRKNAQSYQVGTNVSAWVLQIAKNLCLDFLRKSKKFTESPLEDAEFCLEAKTRNIDDKFYLHNLIANNLKEDEKQIVVLHLINGYKHKEIAKFLNMPIGTVLWKYNRSMKLLKKIIQEESNE